MKLAAAVVAITVASVSLDAQRWPVGGTVTVFIDTSHAPTQGELLATRALNAWTAAANGRVALERTADRRSAQLLVRFASSQATFGETEPRVDPLTRAIASAEVTIANDVAGDALTQRIAIYLTALHELGHALGLPHSDDFTSIMYRFRRPDDGERFFNRYRATLKSAADIGVPSHTGLSTADINALRALYDR